MKFSTDCVSVNEQGNLTLSGFDTVELAKKYGTPLYVISKDKITDTCRQYIASFEKYYAGKGKPIYASKALSCKAMCDLVTKEGFDIDVVSGGEIYTALAAGASASNLHFHGNNKTYSEIEYAISQKVGDIVADNLTEIKTIDEISKEKNVVTNISLRIKPGIDAHTHNFIRTGQIDSKFGFALENGEAYEAVEFALTHKNINLIGLHCHIGSQIMDVEPFVLAAEVMLDVYGKIVKEYGQNLTTLNLGGGFGCKYLASDDFVPYENYMREVSTAVKAKCENLNIEIPTIFIEPGRSVVCEAGLTLYTVGNVKEIANVRNYVSIDGGMTDNPRYALYQADYTCLIANKANKECDYKATVAGKCCESGDLIQENTIIQSPEVGDIMAVLSTGAYNYSMASNYNRNLKPAMVMVSKEDGDKVIIKAETYEDLIRNDL
ncbi:MAG: diaminopimelate decarboxylase [Clostridia bacterium]